VTLSAHNGDGSLRLEVTDTGIGVPRRSWASCSRASTVRRPPRAAPFPVPASGSVIARAIVEAHGGTISLESTEGAGTRVSVTLPAAQAAGGT
jgi:Signal transduction histidine kinase